MSISISINLLGVSPLPLSLPSHTYFLAGASNQMSVLLIYAFYEWERWRGRWPNKKFIHWSFYSQLHLFNVDKDEHAFALSLLLPLSASLSGVIIHTSSSWPTMAWLRLAFIQFLFGLSRAGGVLAQPCPSASLLCKLLPMAAFNGQVCKIA